MYFKTYILHWFHFLCCKINCISALEVMSRTTYNKVDVSDFSKDGGPIGEVSVFMEEFPERFKKLEEFCKKIENCVINQLICCSKWVTGHEEKMGDRHFFYFENSVPRSLSSLQNVNLSPFRNFECCYKAQSFGLNMNIFWLKFLSARKFNPGKFFPKLEESGWSTRKGGDILSKNLLSLWCCSIEF